MGGRPRVRHLECGEHQTVIVNVEETAGHLTGDCADVAGRRDRRPPLCVEQVCVYRKPLSGLTHSDVTGASR
jgi:hypothetical protein